METVWGTNDSRDGDHYLTDLPYGDLDGDGIVDVAVGRLPADPELAMAMLDREDRAPGKRAFVASAYLHDDWPSILAARGGGMWQGKMVGQILDRQGYRVNRSIEHRADTHTFLRGITPLGVRRLITETRAARTVATGLLGSTAGIAAGGAVFTVRALHQAERGLEQYLEHDWTTAGFDRDRAIDRLVGGRDPAGIARDLVAAAARTGQAVPTLGMGLRDAALTASWAALWPNRHPRLTPDRVQDGIRDADTVHYAGRGNGSAWLLPGNGSGHRPVTADDLPGTDARFVFDASSLGARMNDSRPELWRAFLENGAAAYLGSTATTYTPYTTELARRFHDQGHTVGEALRQAVNGMTTDTLDWPTPETIARDGVRGKMLRSFILWGDPTMRKDPPVEPDRWDVERDCTGTRCTVTFTARPDTRIRTVDGDRVLTMPADGTILRAGRPQIPLFKTRLGLPGDADVLDIAGETATRRVGDVTVPVTRLASHGGGSPEPPVRNGTFPDDPSRIDVRETVDGRTVIDIVHAGLRYDPASRTATVMDEIAITVTYRTPLDLAIDTPGTVIHGENLSVDVTAWSDTARDATLHVRTANATTVHTREVPVALRAGRTDHTVDVPLPATGDWSITAHLRAGNHTAGPRTATTTVVPDEPRSALTVPDTVAVGDRFAVTATVTNPLPDPRQARVSVAGQDGVQPVFMEPGTRRVTVPGDGERTVDIPLHAYRAGPATVTVTAGNRTGSVPLTVTERTVIDHIRTTATGLAFTMPDVRVDGTRASRTGTDATLTVRDTVSGRTATLSTPDWTVRTATRENGTHRSLVTPDGRVEAVARGGSTTVTRTGAVPPGRLDARTATLQRELRKLQRIIAARNGTGTHPAPFR